MEGQDQRLLAVGREPQSQPRLAAGQHVGRRAAEQPAAGLQPLGEALRLGRGRERVEDVVEGLQALVPGRDARLAVHEGAQAAPSPHGVEQIRRQRVDRGVDHQRRQGPERIEHGPRQPAADAGVTELLLLVAGGQPQRRHAGGQRQVAEGAAGQEQRLNLRGQAPQVPEDRQAPVQVSESATEGQVYDACHRRMIALSNAC